MRLYTQTIQGIIFYICEIKIGLDTYIGQSTISARVARDEALRSTTPVYND